MSDVRERRSEPDQIPTAMAATVGRRRQMAILESRVTEPPSTDTLTVPVLRLETPVRLDYVVAA